MTGERGALLFVERLPWIVGGYLAASLAASLTISLGLLAWYFVDRYSQGSSLTGFYPTDFLKLWMIAGFFLVICTALPWAVLVGIAETVGLRSARFYASAGAVLALGCWAYYVRKGGLLNFPGIALALAREEMLRTAVIALVVAGAGVVGGLVHWRIAVKR